MRKLVIAFVFLIISLPMFAIQIINENKYPVKFQILEAETCAFYYGGGDISKGGSTVWLETVLFHPDKVCVWAAGVSSTVGAYARTVKNKSCVVRIRDAGFMQGIKIKLDPGC